MKEIPFEDFGGQGDLLHLAHANGYPPGCYRQLIEILTGHYHVIAVHHRPLWPGSRPTDIQGWQNIADDMIRFFDERGLSAVIGIGHSLGAVATMMAAVKRPDLFRRLVLIEPVFLVPAILALISMNPDETESFEFPLVKITTGRRNEWNSYEEAFTHFRRKRVFAGWSDATLWDYLRNGLRPSSAGHLELRYSPEWEARIYSLPPTEVWDLLPQVSQPTLAIRGRETDTLAPGAWELWQGHQPEAVFLEMVETGHLVPMEKPGEVGQAIVDFDRGDEMNSTRTPYPAPP